jgi:hypothetical protein
MATGKLRISPTTDVNSCTDTDDGKSYYAQGTISGHSGDSTYSFTDNCLDSNRLAEYYCTGVIPQATYISCNTQCSNGVCMAGGSPLFAKDVYEDQAGQSPIVLKSGYVGG